MFFGLFGKPKSTPPARLASTSVFLKLETDAEKVRKIREHLERGLPCYIWFGQFDRDCDQIMAATLNDRGCIKVQLPLGYWVEPSPSTRIELQFARS